LDIQFNPFYAPTNGLAGSQMKTQRAYSMELRGAATEATRERILNAAADAFLEQWYDDVTIASVAKRAGVSGQTVINHFGGKEPLAAAAYDRVSQEMVSKRYAPAAGDIRGLVEALANDYETTGDAVIRTLAL